MARNLGAIVGVLALAGILISQTSALAATAPKLQFSRACEPGDQIIVSAIGDILPHTSLAKQAYASPMGFTSLWTKITPYIKVADIAYGNLEGPTAPGVARGGRVTRDPGPFYDGVVYTGTDFIFNYHPRMVTDLKDSGFDILSLANNHSLDRAGIGMDRTIEEFQRADLAFSGARHSQNMSVPLHTRTQAKGLTIAWIACTEATNGMPDPRKQVLLCYQNSGMIVDEIQRLSQDRSVDAIIVAPHWGAEYVTAPNRWQKDTARKFLDAGADAIIGSHPHVLQPVEKYVTRDGRETLIAYSLGNFVSAQSKRIGQKLTALLYVGFTKRGSERAFINGVSYLPLWMERAPYTINALVTTRQAPVKEAYSLLHSLFDPSRELQPGTSVRTNLECQ